MLAVWISLVSSLGMMTPTARCGEVRDWHGYDNFDEIRMRLASVNADNCITKTQEELTLPLEVTESMTMHPSLQHLSTMALNRAMYFSFINQKLNRTVDFSKQPGLLYYYFSTAADVLASEGSIEGAAILYDHNRTYANWLLSLPFNMTLGLFEPRSFRSAEPNNSNRSVDILDYGAGPQDIQSSSTHKLEQWHYGWIPDTSKNANQQQKEVCNVGIKYSDADGSFRYEAFEQTSFYCPPSFDYSQTVYTRPTFDCGRSNKWLVSSVAPVVDFLPRYLPYQHIRGPRYVALSAMDLDFVRYQRHSETSEINGCVFNEQTSNNLISALKAKEIVQKDNCIYYEETEMELPREVHHLVEKQFSNQARTALRLAHFLSNFLQNEDALADEGYHIRSDQTLNIHQLFGEVLANVMADSKIKGSGVFFDTDKFKMSHDQSTKHLFGPYAYRYTLIDDEEGFLADREKSAFRALDYAGIEDVYLDAEWYQHIKEEWQSSTHKLTSFTERAQIRSDVQGTNMHRFVRYPVNYFAPTESNGTWFAPHFECNGYVDEWIIRYALPFFGLSSIDSALEFKGVVVVDVKLDDLDPSQCSLDRP